MQRILDSPVDFTSNYDITKTKITFEKVAIPTTSSYVRRMAEVSQKGCDITVHSDSSILQSLFGCQNRTFPREVLPDDVHRRGNSHNLSNLLKSIAR